MDFYIAEKKLAIELDGCQHEKNKEADNARDEQLRAPGITVLRYKNEEINDSFPTVCKSILSHLCADPERAFEKIKQK